MADGGSLTGIEEAALVVSVGLDPLLFLNTTDSDERNLMLLVANRANKINDIHRRNQAAMIAEEISKLFKK